MSSRTRHLSLTLLAAGSLVLASGCSGDDDASDTMATIPTPSIEVTTVPPSTEPPTTVPPTTQPSTTAVPTTDEPASSPPTTVAPTSDAPATTTTATPTTVAPASAPTPGPTGLGVVDFGAGADDTVAALTAALGEPTEDSGWVEPGPITGCGGTEARRVDWGVLSVVLGEPAGGAAGARQFIAYAYGNVSELGGQPSGLTTAGGIGLGSSVADLQAAYPGVEVFPGEEGLLEAGFAVSDEFHGLLTSDAPDGTVTVLYGGPCE